MIRLNMWVWWFCPIAWCSSVCCKQRVLHQPLCWSDFSNLDIAAAASRLHRSPAVSVVGHAASIQRNAVSTKHRNMLDSMQWMMQYQLHPLPAVSVLMPWKCLVLCSCRDCLYSLWMYFLFRLTSPSGSFFKLAPLMIICISDLHKSSP